MLLEAIASGVRSLLTEKRVGSLDARIWADLGWLTESSSGVTVNAETALRVSTVYACVRLLADTIAQLPISVVRENPDGTTDRVNETPIARVLRGEPNHWQTSFEWRQMMTGHMALRGNAYSLIVGGRRGAIDELIPLNPGRMAVEMATDGKLKYTYQNPRGGQEVFTQDQIFHLRGLSSDGITGMSPIQVARDNIGLAIAMERHGSGLYKNGARPATVIKHPGMLTELAAAKLRQRWDAMHAGVDNAGKTAVLEEGMDISSIGMTPEDAQYIASKEFQTSELARIWRIPLHLIQDTRAGAVGYASVEQLSLAFVKFTLGPWLKTWEEAAKRDLIVQPDLYLKFNLNALLRGDTQARGQFYQTLSNIGVFSPNDVRELEDLDPVEGGDQRFIALNLIPLELASQKALNDMKPEPPPEPPPTGPDAAEEPPAPDEPPPGQNGEAARSACIAIMADAAQRMIAWEASAVKQLLKKQNFIAAVDEFYQKHQERFDRTMRASWDLFQLLGGSTVTRDQMVAKHIGMSRESLLGAAGRATKDTLANEVTAVLDGWQSRAADWTMGGNGNGH